MSIDQLATAPPQLSPDGHWWWDGTAWVPASEAPVAAVVAPEPVHAVDPSAFAFAASDLSAPDLSQPAGFGTVYQATPLRPSTPEGRSLAVPSLVLSILGLCGVGSLLGVVLGHVSRARDRRAGVSPSRLALAGLVLGYVGLALLPVLAAVAVPAFLAQRNAGAEGAVRGELTRVALAQEAWAVEKGGYTRSPADLATTGYVPDPGVAVQVLGADRGEYCLRGTSRAISTVVLYLDTSVGTISAQPCT